MSRLGVLLVLVPLALCCGGPEAAGPSGADTVIDSGVDESGPGSDVAQQDEDCEPQCQGKECGDNECGGSCGSCVPGAACIEQHCVCEPNCTGKACGHDGCGGFCGDGREARMGCPENHDCDGVECVPPCQPDCAGKSCGPDTCGGSCGGCPCTDCAPEEKYCFETACATESKLDCSYIIDCIESCSDSRQNCAQDCVQAVPAELQKAYVDLLDCFAPWFPGCDDLYPPDSPEWEQCWDDYYSQCEDEYFACFPPGDGSCLDLYMCIISCPEGEAGQECYQDCYSASSLEALDRWDIFVDCLLDQDSIDCFEPIDNCRELAWEACDSEFKECAHGTAGCAAILECQESCESSDKICLMLCKADGTIVAQEKLDAVADCVAEQCEENVAPECEATALNGPCLVLHQECMDS